MGEPRTTSLCPLNYRKPTLPQCHPETFYEDGLVDIVVILWPLSVIHVRFAHPIIHERASTTIAIATARPSTDEDFTTMRSIIERPQCPGFRFNHGSNQIKCVLLGESAHLKRVFLHIRLEFLYLRFVELPSTSTIREDKYSAFIRSHVEHVISPWDATVRIVI